MRVFVVFILSLFLAASAKAQKVYYIYLETDNSAAFYVKMADKIYSSSATGYLTISNLVDSTYKFTLGFPNVTRESKFTVPLNAKDRGFLIKHSEDGITLFDLQSLSSIKPETDQTAANVSYQVRTDAFTALLSKASNDSSLLLVPIVAKQEETAKVKAAHEEKPKGVDAVAVETKPKQETISGLSDSTDSSKAKPSQPQTDLAVTTPKSETLKSDSAALANTVASAPIRAEATASGKEEPKDTNASPALMKKEPKPTELAPETTVAAAQPSKADTAASGSIQEEYKPSVVKRHSESSTSEGFGLVFYDTNKNGSVDTIRLVIPNPKHIFKQDDTPLVAQTPTTAPPATPTSSEVNKESKPVKEETPEVKKDSVEVKKDTVQAQQKADAAKDPVQQQQFETAKKSSYVIPAKANCRSIASNNDFFRLRKNMAARSEDEDMVSEAKRYFKNKCYTTEQIRNLSTLFLTSAGKYQFFDAAYAHVADQENFPLLQSEIKDDYYLKRFKALIGE